MESRLKFQISLFLSLFFVVHCLSGQLVQSRTAVFLDSLNTNSWGEGYDYISNLEKMSLIALKEDSFRIHELCRTSIQVTYYELEDYVGYAHALEKSEIFAKDIINSSVSYRSSVLNDKAFLFKLTGDTRNSIELRLEAIDLLIKSNMFDSQLSLFYANLVTDYNLIGDFSKSRLYSKVGIDLLDSGPYVYFDRAKFYHNLGQLDSKELNCYNAILNYQRANLNLRESESENLAAIRLSLDNKLWWAECLVDLDSLMEAKLIIDEINLLQRSFKYRLYKTYEVKAKYYDKLNLQDSTYSYLNKAIVSAINKKKLGSEYSVVPRMYFNLSSFHAKLNQVIQGLEAAQNGLNYFSDTLVMNLNYNPSLKDIWNSEVALNLMILKSDLCRRKVVEDINNSDYEIALVSYNYSLILLSEMRKSFLKDESKFYVLEKALPVYNSYLEMVYKHYSRTNELEDKLIIYKILEETKSAILGDNISYKRKVQEAKVPQKLIEAERNLRLMKTLYTKRMKKMQLEDTISEIIMTDIKDTLFSLNQDYDILDKRIREIQGADLDSRKSKDLELDNFMSLLDDGEMLVDYYVSDNYIYSVSLFDGDIEVDRVELSNVKGSIEQYIAYVSNPPSDHSSFEMEKLSEEIMDTLLKSYISNRDEVHQLRILPSGILNALPFEALSYSSEGTNRFLVEDCSVLYSVSRSQLLQKKGVQDEMKVLAVAPIFDSEVISDTRYACDGAELSNLKYAQEEVEFINTLYETNRSLDSVNSTYFLSSIATNNISHLATHGCVNTSDPLLSELYFNDGPVTGYDILNLDTDISLMFLSACNTARGENVQGEGVIGLTSGFFEAGVRNMISSLWSIDDLSSSQVVKGFYQQVNAGATYADALRSSKMEYLDSSDKLRSHPYYWAGLVQIGAGVSVNDTYPWVMYVIGCLCLILCFFVFNKKIISSK